MLYAIIMQRLFLCDVVQYFRRIIGEELDVVEDWSSFFKKFSWCADFSWHMWSINCAAIVDCYDWWDLWSCQQGNLGGNQHQEQQQQQWYQLLFSLYQSDSEPRQFKKKIKRTLNFFQHQYVGIRNFHSS